MKQNKSENLFLQTRASLGTRQAWFTPIKNIIKNDYILSANTYNPYSGEETTTHREPKEILREIGVSEQSIASQIKELQKLLK